MVEREYMELKAGLGTQRMQLEVRGGGGGLPDIPGLN